MTMCFADFFSLTPHLCFRCVFLSDEVSFRAAEESRRLAVEVGGRRAQCRGAPSVSGDAHRIGNRCRPAAT